MMMNDITRCGLGSNKTKRSTAQPLSAMLDHEDQAPNSTSPPPCARTPRHALPRASEIAHTSDPTARIMSCMRRGCSQE